MPIIFDKVLIILTEMVKIISGYGQSFERSGRNYNRYGDNFDPYSLYKIITPKEDHQIQP